MDLVALVAQESSESSSPFSFLILLLLPVLMYVVLIRPQRKRMKEQAALQSQVGIGDEVITTSGIYGFITGVDEDGAFFWLEIDENVQIRIAKAAIQGKAPGSPTDTETASEAEKP